MARPAATRSDQEPEYGTLPAAARSLGVGVKLLRRKGLREGKFPVYDGDGAWRRVKFSEVEDWFRSTRVAPTDHARARVAEVLEREKRAEP